MAAVTPEGCTRYRGSAPLGQRYTLPTTQFAVDVVAHSQAEEQKCTNTCSEITKNIKLKHV